MADHISTHYVKSGYATSDDIVLSQTPTTRTVLRPALHAGGVRGEVIRQKIGEEGNWADINDVDFRKLPADCGVAIELSTEATALLHTKLTQLYEVQKQKGAAPGDHSYVVAGSDEVVLVTGATRQKAIKELVDGDHSEEFWNELAKKDADLASRLAASQLQLVRETAIRQFADDIATYVSDEDHWQQFFETHPWMLQAAFSSPVFMLRGEAYVGGKRAAGRQGSGGVATDFLFSDESTKVSRSSRLRHLERSSLVGCIEVGADSGDAQEIYSASPGLSGGVVQTRNQMAVAVDHFKSVIGDEFKDLNQIHPKGVLIVGDSSGLTERKKASFNFFRQGLFSMTVITYDELLSRLGILYDVRVEELGEPKR
ncbi:MAG: DUF4263 domain-containing protein [Candidatus Microthrix sp.]|uniref:DUF4263 domain-containing protein n=1 Tax=Candidatus Neomicrothrix subdominans TaxID=2954438 RepID=A0A936TE11_9ACTN|nr:DUF4263 domain-containing protein [Candidatus Microthrix subdominans]